MVQYIYPENIMPQNPLQQYFRQPKIYISLPSAGVYNRQDTFSGDVTRMPIYGMTGMDEILMKTPDALLSGESTLKVIKSCCPTINNPEDISNLDVDLILTAIRIATYGNTLNAKHTCPKCSTENDYEIDLSVFIDHYSKVTFDNRIEYQDLTIIVKPITLKEANSFSLRNFELQQKLKQVLELKETEERKNYLIEIYNDLSNLQNDVYLAGIESVSIGSQAVTEKGYISEWLRNTDAVVSDHIKKQLQKNQEELAQPPVNVACDNCGEKSNILIDLNQANFFEVA